VDPDPFNAVSGSVSEFGFAIRIWIQEGKNTDKNRKKVNKFYF
jgi:hypothetical protein